MRSAMKENIMEHSEQVAQLAHMLAVIHNTIYGGNVNVAMLLSTPYITKQAKSSLETCPHP
jgi:5'-deoxynucleotidase YfbR-like HD superfamily hydrolase